MRSKIGMPNHSGLDSDCSERKAALANQEPPVSQYKRMAYVVGEPSNLNASSTGGRRGGLADHTSLSPPTTLSLVVLILTPIEAAESLTRPDGGASLRDVQPSPLQSIHLRSTVSTIVDFARDCSRKYALVVAWLLPAGAFDQVAGRGSVSKSGSTGPTRHPTAAGSTSPMNLTDVACIAEASTAARSADASRSRGTSLQSETAPRACTWTGACGRGCSGPPSGIPDSWPCVARTPGVNPLPGVG